MSGSPPPSSSNHPSYYKDRGRFIPNQPRSIYLGDSHLSPNQRENLSPFILKIYIRNWSKLLPVFPLLVIPILTDALHSLLIKQEIENGEILPSHAIKQVWTLIPSLLGIKLYFECAAILWAFVPIYGIIQGAKHRMYWAMCSNVLVFENLPGKAGRKRCRELVKGFRGGIGVRTLITIPALLVTMFLILWVVNASFIETSTTYGVWVLIVLVFWIIIPASAAVNTFFYLREKESEE